jgi:hypothetical protein
MNMIDRRSVVRSAGMLFALPFAAGLAPSYASETAEFSSVPQPNRIRLSNTASTSVSLDLLNFVKDHSAGTVAAKYMGRAGSYSALADQYHLLGKHLSLAGADKAVKAHCRKLLKAGSVPTLDPKAVAHAVSCVRAYAPSYSAKDLLSSTVLPSTAHEWTVQLKKLKKNGVVKYLHRAGRQLNAMQRATYDRPTEQASANVSGQYTNASYTPTYPSQAAHIVEICSLQQKLKFFACLGAVVAVGLIIIAAVVALCGATALAACLGGAGAATFYIAGFGLLTGAAIAACGAFLSSYNKKANHPAVLSAI